jgi:hypothetical protein
MKLFLKKIFLDLKALILNAIPNKLLGYLRAVYGKQKLSGGMGWFGHLVADPFFFFFFFLGYIFYKKKKLLRVFLLLWDNDNFW